MTQYFTDVLQKPTSSLPVPDLQAIAKDHNMQATLTMCRLTIVIGVQCERNKEFIDKIQGLSEGDQHYLMKAIEQVSLWCLKEGCVGCVNWVNRLWPRSRRPLGLTTPAK